MHHVDLRWPDEENGLLAIIIFNERYVAFKFWQFVSGLQVVGQHSIIFSTRRVPCVL